MQLIFHRNSSMVLTVIGLTDGLTGALISDAVIEVSLVDGITDAPVGGQSWPAPFFPVVGSPGDYRCLFEPDLAVEEGGRYLAKITATKSGVQRYWEERVFVQ